MVILVVGFVPLTLIPSVESDHLGSCNVVDEGSEHEEEHVVDEGIDNVDWVLTPEDSNDEHDVCDDTVCPTCWREPLNSPEVGIGILSLLDVGKSPKNGNRTKDNFVDPSH